MNAQHDTSPRNLDQIRTFVHGLPDIDRKILMLHYAEELDAAEVAGILRLSRAQVETRITALRTVARVVIDGVHLSKAG